VSLENSSDPSPWFLILYPVSQLSGKGKSWPWANCWLKCGYFTVRKLFVYILFIWSKLILFRVGTTTHHPRRVQFSECVHRVIVTYISPDIHSVYSSLDILRSQFRSPSVILPDVQPRQERAIRSHPDHKTSWYLSKGRTPITVASLDRLSMSPAPRAGDLFLHWYGGTDNFQVFLCEGVQQGLCWNQIQNGHQHPHLPTHKLHIGTSGTPTWVLPSTISTYRGPARKLAKSGHNETYSR